jgi:hypothetical protein
LNKRTLGPLALLGLLAATSVSAQGVKWHPGHYVILNMGDSQSQHFATIKDLGDESSIKGYMLRLYWAQLETSKGVYNFALIDTYLRQIKAQPVDQRLVLRVMDRRFGGTTSSGIVPKYLTTESSFNGGLIKTHSGYAARLWEKAVMDREIALFKALGAHYDKDMLFEGLSTEETTLSLPTPYPSSYSDAVLETQWQRLAASVKPVMPTTNLFVLTNWLGSSKTMGTLIQSFTSSRAAAGSSNIIPSSPNTGQQVWMGWFGADYRGLLPIGNGVETSELGGKHGDYTPKQLGDYAYNTLKANYVFWTMNTWEGDSTQRWSTGILPYLRKFPPVRTGCPRVYAWCFK